MQTAGVQSAGATFIVDRDAEAGGRETLPPTDGLQIIDRATFVAMDVDIPAHQRICINSEAAMDDVLARLDPNRASGIRTLKDKTAFREVLASIYPTFFFTEIPMDRLGDADLDPSKQYVVKPALGCFGTGVRVVEGSADLASLQREIQGEVERNSAVLSSTVLSADTLIIEQYIEGEEYAIDMYFDSNGDPQITNIYHHPMPANPAYLHMVYYSSKDVFDLVFDQGMDFLRSLGGLLRLGRVPLHCEFRLENGNLVPIEINAMRFGGMGLANLGWYSHKSNAYEHFINDTAPDWPSMLAEDASTASVFFIAYNGTEVDTATMEPRWDALESRFSHIVRSERFDYRIQLAFGILYAREPFSSIPQLLEIDFNDFFAPVEFG